MLAIADTAVDACVRLRCLVEYLIQQLSSPQIVIEELVSKRGFLLRSNAELADLLCQRFHQGSVLCGPVCSLSFIHMRDIESQRCEGDLDQLRALDGIVLLSVNDD